MDSMGVNVVDKVSEAGEMNELSFSLALVAAKELAQILRISESTLWAWLDQKGPHFVREFPRPLKIGKNCTRWRASDVEAYLAKAAEVRHVE